MNYIKLKNLRVDELKSINIFRSTIFLWLIMFLLVSQAKGQELQKNIKAYLKEQTQIKVDKKVKNEQKVDSAALVKKKSFEEEVIDSLYLIALDSSKKEVIEEIDPIEPPMDEIPTIGKTIDTLALKKRLVSVKTRKPRTNAQSEEEWNALLYLDEGKSYTKDHVLDTTYQVFGWHPYWMGTSYKSYNFSLLTTIAYFSYEVNPSSGGYQTIHDWRTTALIDSAHSNDCKVLLSATNFGYNDNRIFLDNLSGQQQKFIDTIITLIKERNGDGVNIDFEGIPRGYREKFSNFIIDLSTSLKNENPSYQLTVAIPAKDFNQVYDIGKQSDYVDQFIIMGYEFYGQNSKVAGPVAPLTSGDVWWEFNVERSILEYKVAEVDPKKILLGVPYYGAEWVTHDLTFPSKAKRFIKYPTYREIRSNYGELDCCEEDNSKSMYHVKRNQQQEYKQIWYDGPSSLNAKYQLVKDQELGGIGIWALGYDNGYPELWETIANNFALTEEQVAAARAPKLNIGFFRRWINYGFSIARNPKMLVTNPRPLFSLMGIFSGVSMMGIFILMRFGCNMKRFTKMGLRGIIMLCFLVIFGLISLGMRFIGLHEILYLLGGVLIGLIVFFILSLRVFVKKELP